MTGVPLCPAFINWYGDSWTWTSQSLLLE
jgi:hypothetical protein